LEAGGKDRERGEQNIAAKVSGRELMEVEVDAERPNRIRLKLGRRSKTPKKRPREEKMEVEEIQVSRLAEVR